MQIIRVYEIAIPETPRADQRPVANKRQASLRHWRFETTNNGIWARLSGQVYGHPKFADGEAIVTSPVLRLDIPGHTAETMHTLYQLEG